MTPLEKGARALALSQSGVDDFDALDEAFQENLKEHVRAVLEGAFREPNEAVTEALRLSILREYGINQESRGRLIRMVHDILDAALTE